MPLPPPTAARERKHLRSVSIAGYKREDGLWDMEARIVDAKDHDFKLHSGMRRAGEPVHDMQVRLTIDTRFNIVAACASSESVAYPGHCETIAPDYSRLVGLNLMRGFRQAVRERFAGVSGCTHITELLQLFPTAAVQSFAGEGYGRQHEADHQPFQLDRCHALIATGPAVARYYPKWYRGPAMQGEAGAHADQHATSKEDA